MRNWVRDNGKDSGWSEYAPYFEDIDGRTLTDSNPIGLGVALSAKAQSLKAQSVAAQPPLLSRYIQEIFDMWHAGM